MTLVLHEADAFNSRLCRRFKALTPIDVAQPPRPDKLTELRHWPWRTWRTQKYRLRKRTITLIMTGRAPGSPSKNIRKRRVKSRRCPDLQPTAGRSNCFLRQTCQLRAGREAFDTCAPAVSGPGWIRWTHPAEYQRAGKFGYIGVSNELHLA